MFSALKVKHSQGRQYVADVRGARPAGFHGRPVIADTACATDCRACADVCPTQAITLEPLGIDLGRCVFCNECVEVCPVPNIAFTPDPRMSAATPEGLRVTAATADALAVPIATALRGLFGRSLKLRSVSAGGCNACELELNAMANVNFDFGRFGIDWVASPRHADGLVLSGPLTKNMAGALELAYEGMPSPKFIVAFGACAISGGLYANSEALDRRFLERFAPSLYVPGCPPHPLTFLHALLDLLGIPTPDAPEPDRPPPARGFDPRTIATRTAAASRLAAAVGGDLGRGPQGSADPSEGGST